MQNFAQKLQGLLSHWIHLLEGNSKNPNWEDAKRIRNNHIFSMIFPLAGNMIKFSYELSRIRPTILIYTMIFYLSKENALFQIFKVNQLCEQL